MIFNNKGGGSFTILPNKLIMDKQLSFKARGVLAYLLSRPVNWDVTARDIVNQTTDGREAIYSALKELIEARYVIRGTKRTSGKITQYVYDVYNSPQTGFPETEKPYTENLYTENPTQLNTELTNTDITKDLYTSTEVDDTLKGFLIQLIGELGFSDKVQVTPKRLSHLKSRLKTFSREQMSSAAAAVVSDPWLQGKNPGNKKYGTIDYLLRSDEQLETLLLNAPAQAKSRFEEILEHQNAR